MSSSIHPIVEETFAQEAGLGTDVWERDIVPLLPKDVEESAWRLGAMRRKNGKIRQASDLLRGILAYVLCVGSFRELGVWGVLTGVADLADTSWRDRLRKASNWLFWLVSELLRIKRSERVFYRKKAGYGEVELVDASHWKCVGKHGTTWRVHCLYSLFSQQLQQVVVSGTKTKESITNFCIRAGNIYVHDSGYGYRREVAYTRDAGAYTVTAFYPGSFPLEEENGAAIDIIAWLKRQRAKERSIRSRSAFFQEGGKRYEVRVIALRRTKEQTKRELHKKQRHAVRDHRKLQEETVYLASWLLILTTLPACDWSEQEVLSLYRARWQIEIFFKRVKQLLKQHTLRAETEETAKATIAAILVSWVLQQEIAEEMRSLLEEMHQGLEEQKGEEEGQIGEEVKQDMSEWVIETISVKMFRQHVQGMLNRQRVRECVPRLMRHVKNRPRKRAYQWQCTRHWLVDLERGGDAPGGGERRNDRSARSTALT